MKKTIYLLTLLLFAPLFSEAQDIKTLDRISEQYAQKTFPLLRSFLRLPNDANKPLAYEANMLWSEEVFQDRGKHARAAIGCSSLPLGASVEVEAIFEIKLEVNKSKALGKMSLENLYIYRGYLLDALEVTIPKLIDEVDSYIDNIEDIEEII